MIIQNKVKLHNDSVEHMNGVFAMYTEVEELARVLTNPIVHMYPHSDTTKRKGKLDGYVDALFFKADIYDTETRTVFKGERLNDSINPWGDIDFKTIRIFKDLSTMIVLNGTYQIWNDGPAIDIRKA